MIILVLVVVVIVVLFLTTKTLLALARLVFALVRLALSVLEYVWASVESRANRH